MEHMSLRSRTCSYRDVVNVRSVPDREDSCSHYEELLYYRRNHHDLIVVRRQTF